MARATKGFNGRTEKFGSGMVWSVEHGSALREDGQTYHDRKFALLDGAKSVNLRGLI